MLINNNLTKHQSKRICIVDGILSGMKVGNVYTATNCEHMKACETLAGKKLVFCS